MPAHPPVRLLVDRQARVCHWHSMLWLVMSLAVQEPSGSRAHQCEQMMRACGTCCHLPALHALHHHVGQQDWYAGGCVHHMCVQLMCTHREHKLQ